MEIAVADTAFARNAVRRTAGSGMVLTVRRLLALLVGETFNDIDRRRP
jgi:hypothetical protein